MANQPSATKMNSLITTIEAARSRLYNSSYRQDGYWSKLSKPSYSTSGISAGSAAKASQYNILGIYTVSTNWGASSSNASTNAIHAPNRANTWDQGVPTTFRHVVEAGTSTPGQWDNWTTYINKVANLCVSGQNLSGHYSNNNSQHYSDNDSGHYSSNDSAHYPSCDTCQSSCRSGQSSGDSSMHYGGAYDGGCCSN